MVRTLDDRFGNWGFRHEVGPYWIVFAKNNCDGRIHCLDNLFCWSRKFKTPEQAEKWYEMWVAAASKF